MRGKTRKNEQGFSLIELLIVSVILLMILGIMAIIVSGVQSNYRTYRARAEKHTDALASLNLISRVIKNAGNNTTQPALTATGNNRLQIKSDWTTTDNSLDDSLEDVDFYVNNNTLYMVANGTSPTTVELSANIQSINFEYFDANGASTSTMSQVARVRVTLSIMGENQSLVSEIAIRGRIQPK